VLVAVIALGASVVPSDAGRRYRGGGPENFIGSIIGGVIGGAIVGTMQPPPVPRYAPEYYDPVAECAMRFRSYDPRTGFYRGYDGYLRRCP